MDLEKNFEEVSKLVNNWQLVMQGQQANFNDVDYIKQMRIIRKQLRGKMLQLGIAVVGAKESNILKKEIQDMALELDKAMTINAANGNYIAEFNAAFQLYDLLNDYSTK